jgi:hypothetical protein
MYSKICLLTVIPVRREPNDRSEIITQLLFGETCVQVENDETSNFIKIKADFDDYEGWVDEKQLTPHKKEDNDHFLSYSLETLNSIVINEVFKIAPLGSVIQHAFLEDHKIQFIGNEGLLTPKDIISSALKYMNTPYLWGGKSQFGIDCSGFVQQVFKVCGVYLPRDAYQQVEVGHEIDFDELEEGDLAYFGKDKITHVGIILKDNKIIHAHGFVRINAFDKKGILKDDLQDYSHLVRAYRRI